MVPKIFGGLPPCLRSLLPWVAKWDRKSVPPKTYIGTITAPVRSASFMRPGEVGRW